jgi:hypothetical protein
MGSSSKSGARQDCYFGTLAALICAGPVDELVGIAADGKLIWPEAPAWADGLVEARTAFRKRAGNVATVWTEKEHGLKNGDQVTLSGFGDASFNATAASVLAASAFAFTFANAGSNVAKTADSAGRVTKNVAYTAGDLVHDGATVWQCVTGHTSSLATRPPHPYWTGYALKRSVVGDAPFAITIPDWGAVDFYWGTADQELLVDADPTSARAIFIAAGHPPYRRQCWALLRDFKFGVERQAAPNLEFIVRRAPNQAAITGAAAALNDGQANPIAALAELVKSDVWGIGSAVPLAGSFQALADELAAAADATGLSLVLDTAETLRAIVARLVAYYDGWFRFSRAGELEAGRFLHNEAPPAFTDANTIDFHDLIEEIAWESTGWQDTFSRTTVRYSDRQAAFKTLPAEYASGFNRAVTGEDRRQTLDRPWIVRQLQALAHAAELGKIAAEPRLAGSLVVRAEKAAALGAGDIFRLVHDAAQLALVCRCTQKTWAQPPAGRVTLRFESERGASALPYAAPAYYAAEPPLLPRPEAIRLYQLVPPPPALTGQPYGLAVLAARSSSLTVGLRLWMQEADPSLFSELGDQRRWAVAGKLDAGLAGADTSFDITLDEHTLPADLGPLTESLSEDDIANARVLVWVFSSVTPSLFEVMALKSITVNGAAYTLEVNRGAFRSTVRSFTTDDRVWLSFRADLVTYTQDAFFDLATAAATATFRLQSFTANAEADLADPDLCPDIGYVFGDPWALDDRPAINWSTPSSSPYSLATSGNLTPAADLSDAGGNLIKVELWSKNEQTALITSWVNRAIPPTAATTLGEVFTLAGVSPPLHLGTQGVADQYFTLTLRLTDAAGFVTDSSLALILPGTGGAGVGAVAFAPLGQEFHPEVTVNLSITAPASRIHYAVTSPGSNPPGSYTTYVGTAINVTFSESRRIWARASDGTNHGAWNYQDYTRTYGGGGGR